MARMALLCNMVVFYLLETYLIKNNAGNFNHGCPISMTAGVFVTDREPEQSFWPLFAASYLTFLIASLVFMVTLR